MNDIIELPISNRNTTWMDMNENGLEIHCFGSIYENIFGGFVASLWEQLYFG